jgi:glyoxylase-like metal-dependent hydrolase (beta-lactamase superfamily II)
VPSDVLTIADRPWRGEVSTSTMHPVDHIGGFVEIADGVGFTPSFANVSAFETEDGLVLVDTGSLPLADVVHDDIRRWSDSRLHTAVYSHGHIDHVFGVPVWEQEARERGWKPPEVITHHALPARFDSYLFTAATTQSSTNVSSAARTAVAHHLSLPRPHLPRDVGALCRRRRLHAPA